MSPVLFFLHMIALTIWTLSWFHVNFSIFSISIKKLHWNFDKDCIEPIGHFGWYGHFNNVNYSNTWTHDIFTFICVCSSLFHWLFKVFSIHKILRIYTYENIGSWHILMPFIIPKVGYEYWNKRKNFPVVCFHVYSSDIITIIRIWCAYFQIFFCILYLNKF